MPAQVQTTIGETMTLVAAMLGLEVDDIEGFVVIVNTTGEDGYLLHNAQTYHVLVQTLLQRAQSLLAEMQVDQAIEFGEMGGT